MEIGRLLLKEKKLKRWECLLVTIFIVFISLYYKLEILGGVYIAYLFLKIIHTGFFNYKEREFLIIPGNIKKIRYFQTKSSSIPGFYLEEKNGKSYICFYFEKDQHEKLSKFLESKGIKFLPLNGLDFLCLYIH